MAVFAAPAHHTFGNWIRPRQPARRNCGRYRDGQRSLGGCQASVVLGSAVGAKCLKSDSPHSSLEPVYGRKKHFAPEELIILNRIAVYKHLAATRLT